MKFIQSLLFGISLCWMGNASAQLQNVMVGAEIGYSKSLLIGDAIGISETTPSYIGGAFVQYRVNKYFAIRGGLNYENKGTQATFSMTDVNGHYTGEGIDAIKCRYMVIPVLARLSLGNRIKGFFDIGPYLGRLLMSNEIISGPGMNTISRDVSNRFRKLDYGVSAGLGLGVAIGSSWFLSFELRSNVGIYNINNFNTNSNTLRNSSSNAFISLGYRLEQ